MLAWRARGCKSFREWSAAHPEDVDMLRKGAMAISAAVERRQRQYLEKHFGVISLCDYRLPERKRDAVAMGLARKARCCLTHGLHRSLVDFVKRLDVDNNATVEQIAETLRSLAPYLFLVAFFIRLSVACIERLHAMRRSLYPAGKTSFHVLGAKSVCTRVNEANSRLGPKPSPQQPRASPKRESSGLDFSKLKRALSSFEAFRKRLRAAEETEGIIRIPASRETLTYYRESWSRASIEEESICDELAAATKAACEHSRRMANASSSTSMPPGAVPIDDGRHLPPTDAVVLPPEHPEGLGYGADSPTPLLGEACQVGAAFHDPLVARAFADRVPVNTAAPKSKGLDDFFEGTGFFDGQPKRLRSNVPKQWRDKIHAASSAEPFQQAIVMGRIAAQCAPLHSTNARRAMPNCARPWHTWLSHKAQGATPRTYMGKMMIAVKTLARVDFVRACEAQASHGRFPAKQMFARLEVVEGTASRHIVGRVSGACARRSMSPTSPPRAHCKSLRAVE